MYLNEFLAQNPDADLIEVRGDFVRYDPRNGLEESYWFCSVCDENVFPDDEHDCEGEL